MDRLHNDLFYIHTHPYIKCAFILASFRPQPQLFAASDCRSPRLRICNCCILHSACNAFIVPPVATAAAGRQPTCGNGSIPTRSIITFCIYCRTGGARTGTMKATQRPGYTIQTGSQADGQPAISRGVRSDTNMKYPAISSFV